MSEQVCEFLFTREIGDGDFLDDWIFQNFEWGEWFPCQKNYGNMIFVLSSGGVLWKNETKSF